MGDAHVDANTDLARVLYELGVLTGRAGGTGARHRAAAYRRASLTIAGCGEDVLALPDDQLLALPGVGRGVAARVEEVRRTGRIAALDRLREDDPAGVEVLMTVPGVGRKTAARLRDHLGVRDLDGLRAAVAAGRLVDVPGIGPVTATRITAAVEAADERDGAPAPLPIGVAVMAAERLEDALRAVLAGRADPPVPLHPVGELARMRDLVGRVELLAVTDDPAGVLAAAGAAPSVREIGQRRPDAIEVVMFEGVHATVQVAAPAQAGVRLLHATADPAHWRQLQRRAEDRGLRLDPEGLGRPASGPVPGARPDLAGPDGVAGACGPDGADAARPGGRARTPVAEQLGLAEAGTTAAVAGIYRLLGLQPIPAEQRDGTDEISLAARGALPRCADVGDLRGDLHDHTEWSGDGRMTLPELLDGARQRSWEYLAVTDHAEDLTINGLSRDMMRAQARALRRLADDRPELTVLHGAELNIDRGGGVDYDPEFLTGFGWTVASVHSHFRLEVAEQTRRLVRAIENPAVSAIGHLTGRRIGRREGIDLDLDVVLDALVRTGTALEANCHLDRFDAPAEVLREAAARGVRVVISTDAHSVGELDNHRWGVALARRGRVPAESVANTWPAARFLEWIR